MMRNPFCASQLFLFAACAIVPTVGFSQTASPSEIKLHEMLGPSTPKAIRLWEGLPPDYIEPKVDETVDENVRIRGVSIPTLTPYLSKDSSKPCMAMVVCAGGGYGGHDWRTHVVYAAEVMNPMGIAVIGLKYRTRPPYLGANEEIQRITLLDAKRAIRMVRSKASEWKIDPERIGIVGYSAGANLAMNMAANFDVGDPSAADPIDRLSSRPAFAVGLGTWHWRKPVNPFIFKRDSPPVFLVHATTDKPVEIATNIVADLKKLGVPARLDMYEEGGHGVGNLIPTRVAHDFPPTKWPQHLVAWLDELAKQP